MYMFLFFLAFIFILPTRTHAQTCYFANGGVDTRSVPCRAEIAGSHCCAEQDQCLDNGLCLSDNSVVVGGCTYRNWDHPACFQQCKEATTRTKLSPTDNDSDAYCCTAYETVNDTLCTNIHDGSSRLAFTLPTSKHAGLESTAERTSPQQTLHRRQESPCPATMSTSTPVIVGVSVGIPLSAALFITTMACIIQRKQLWHERRKATKVAAKNEAGRAYVVLPNQRVVMGRGIVRASQSIFEGADNSFEIDGRELKRDEWPLPPLPPLRKAQGVQRSQTTPTGYRKPSLGGSTIVSAGKQEGLERRRSISHHD